MDSDEKCLNYTDIDVNEEAFWSFKVNIMISPMRHSQYAKSKCLSSYQESKQIQKWIIAGMSRKDRKLYQSRKLWKFHLFDSVSLTF